MKRDIIIYLIQQEFKYHHFIFQLEKAGLIYEDNSISLLEVIQPILGIQKEGIGKFPSISDELGDRYQMWIDKAIQSDGDDFEILAKECYQELNRIITSSFS